MENKLNPRQYHPYKLNFPSGNLTAVQNVDSFDIYLLENITGNLNIGGILSVGSLMAGAISMDTITGFVDVSGSMNINGPTSITGNFTVTGDSIFKGNVRIDGDVTGLHIHNIDNSLSIGGDLAVTGDYFLTGSQYITENISCNSTGFFGGNINVTGDVNISGDINLKGNLNGSLNYDLLAEIFQPTEEVIDSVIVDVTQMPAGVSIKKIGFSIWTRDNIGVFPHVVLYVNRTGVWSGQSWIDTYDKGAVQNVSNLNITVPQGSKLAAKAIMPATSGPPGVSGLCLLLNYTRT